MLKFRIYFVQFIVWEVIPSGLPFGMDVIPKSRERREKEITKVNLKFLYLALININELRVKNKTKDTDHKRKHNSNLSVLEPQMLTCHKFMQPVNYFRYNMSKYDSNGIM